MDVRDMKHYRALIRDFMNEIVVDPISLPVKIFLTEKVDIGFTL